MKLKMIALGLGYVLVAQTAYSQTTTANSGNPGGAVAGGNNTVEALPPSAETRDQSLPSTGALQSGQNATNRAAAIPPNVQGTGTEVNKPRVLPPTPRSDANSSSITAASDDAPKSDQHIKSTIRQTLATEISTSSGESYSSFSGTLPISCDVQDGVATLTGSVASEQQKEKIELIVQQVPGVTRVDNQLLVTDATVSTAGIPSASGSGTNGNQLSPTSTTRTNRSAESGTNNGTGSRR